MRKHRETTRKESRIEDRGSRIARPALDPPFSILDPRSYTWRWLLPWVITASLFGAAGLASPGDDTPGSPSPPAPSKSAPAQSSGQPARTHGADLIKFPGDAIYVIGKEIKDALSVSPEMYLLRKEEYAALKARIEQLERLVNPGKPVPPSSCRLTGQVEGDLVHIQVQFNFTTTEPRTLVSLGCQRSWPTAATMDEGKLPLLLPAGEDGWNVQAESPGAHTLILDVELALATKEGEVGFDVGLPRAAITNLEQFTLPVPVPEVRLHTSGGSSLGRMVKTQPVDSQHTRLVAAPLGAADRLSLAWKNLGRKPQQGAPLLTSQGRIKVQVEESHVLTDVQLTLQVRRGETDKWRIRLPFPTTLDLKEPQEGDDRVKRIHYPTAQEPTLTIDLQEPSAETMRVAFQVRQSWPESPLAVGPFVIAEAFRQWGTIRIAEPADLRLRYHVHGDVTRRDLSADSGRDNLQAEFSYWNLNATPGQPLEPPLEIEKVKGIVETKVEHELRLTERGWQVLSKFKITPIRTSVDRLELSIDPQLYDSEVGASSSSFSVEDVTVDASRRLATVKFQKQSRPFDLKWPGLYRLSSEKEQQTGGHLKLELPRCLQTLDRGGQVTAILPPEGWELVAGRSLSEELRPGEREYTWRSDRAPLWAELAWRPYRPELGVDSVVDVKLEGHRARILHQLHLHWSQASASQLRLTIPPSVKTPVRIEPKEARLRPDGTVFLAKPLDKDRTLTLEYSFPLPSAGESVKESRTADRGSRIAPPALDPPSSILAPRSFSFDVPLVGVEGATRSETKIRIWSEQGIQAALAKGSWEERPTEVVAGQDSVPNLVLWSIRPDPSLRLQLTNVTGLRSPDILIDRVLFKVAITPESVQSYLARYLVSRINTRRLDIQLPGSLGGPLPQVFLGGKRIPVQSAEGGKIRLSVEPELFRSPVVLEIAYQVVSDSRNGNEKWQTTLYPPLVEEAVFIGPVRWQVAYPPDWLSFYQGGGFVSEQHWAWHGGMLTPQPAMSRAELDRWLTAPAGSPVVPAAWAPPGEEVEPKLVCQQASPQALYLLHISRKVWLLACSLVFLVVGLALTVSSIPRFLFWALVAVVGLGGAGVGIYWPGLLAAVIYGCEPGVVILAFLLAIQWMLQKRYRRRVVFLPGFTRFKPGSSLARAGGGDRSRLEPSTVDAPPLPPSGHATEVKGQ